MKILLYTDNHFCESASIVSKYGNKYTVRLENQIKSVNWTEQLAKDNDCHLIVCLGDFFDKQALTDQEITAINDIDFSNKIDRYFLVGNHESEEIDLKYSSTQILNRVGTVISKPISMVIDNVELCFLPYTTERNITSLRDIFGECTASKRIIFSHNDIAGIQMGAIVSKAGFPIDDIEANCDVFLNGHLHNGTKITDKIVNLGNLTGKDFGEDAFKYRHSAFILDTELLTLTEIENPYAFNFYQLTIMSEADLNQLDVLKDNAVLRATCRLPLVNKLNSKLEELGNKIVEHKTITVQVLDDGTEAELDATELTVDYLTELCACCKSKLENTPILDFELAEICK